MFPSTNKFKTATAIPSINIILSLFYTKLSYPLHCLIRKGAPFEWSPDCEATLDTLKTKFLTSPVLAYPNFNKDFTLETDTSKYGLGAWCHLVTV